MLPYVKFLIKISIKYICAVDTLKECKETAHCLSQISCHDGCELSKLNSKAMNLLVKSGTSMKMIIFALGLVSYSELKT